MRWAIRLDHPLRKRVTWDGDVAGRVGKARRHTWPSRATAEAAVACVKYSVGWQPTIVNLGQE